MASPYAIGRAENGSDPAALAVTMLSIFNQHAPGSIAGRVEEASKAS